MGRSYKYPLMKHNTGVVQLHEWLICTSNPLADCSICQQRYFMMVFCEVLTLSS